MSPLFFFRFKFLAVDEKIDGNVEIFGEPAEHPNVRRTLAVFVVRECLTADAKIHSELDLTAFSLLSDHLQPNKPLVFLHLSRFPKNPKNSTFCKFSIDNIVTKCYNKDVTICNKNI